MTFAWTAHRFSGGALALDVANSVILRHLPERRIDRFADAAHLQSFAEAASRLCAERDLAAPLAEAKAANPALLLALREASDSYFRARCLGHDEDRLLAQLAMAAGHALEADGATPSLEKAAARSALRLVASSEPERVKICGHCGWLFLDRSRNRSRTWCDMAVCGNRSKASRHYRRHRDAPE